MAIIALLCLLLTLCRNITSLYISLNININVVLRILNTVHSSDPVFTFNMGWVERYSVRLLLSWINWTRR
jgi:hypothetical protein